MAMQIQFRRGTAAQWTAADPILAQGEMGIELDTGKYKIGNGTSTWTVLLYPTNATISTLPDVDNTSVTDGSLLVYSTATSKWTATLELVKQSMDGGFY